MHRSRIVCITLALISCAAACAPSESEDDAWTGGVSGSGTDAAGQPAAPSGPDASAFPRDGSTDGRVGLDGGSQGALGGGTADAGAQSAEAGLLDAGGGRDGGEALSDAMSTVPDSGPQVGLPPGVTHLFPPPNGEDVCPDPPLRLRFPGTPSLGTSGKIQVFEASGKLVASVDMAASNVTDTIGGTSFKRSRPVFVDGDEVVVYLKSKALSLGQSYYVTVSEGAIRPSGGGSFSINGVSGWRFSTRSSAPKDLTALGVALDGSGDFCSLQGALDALPSQNPTRAVVTLRSGLYHEIVNLSGKSDVTIRGEDRKKTVILGTNNDNLNPGTKTRALMGFTSTSGLIVENLTIHNLTPQGGSQAEALRLQGCDKCVVRHADILSLQDTLLWSGRIYAEDCYVEGNVDYVWGTGVVYFNQCEFRTVGRTGVLVQSRNAVGAYGYVFVDSKLTAEAVAKNNVLARIDASVYPGSHVAFINCQMENVSAAGWTTTGFPSSSLRFWEYQSHDAAGKLLDTSQRASVSKQISESQAAMMRDKATVLGGWQPPQ